MRILTIIGLGLALAACQTASPTAKTTDAISDEQAFKLARARLLDTLKDPDSAKIDPVFVRKTSNPTIHGRIDIVCGRVNGKNVFGAYTGMKVWVYKIADNQILIDGEDGDRYGPIATIWCS
jgi:hypothetical protein